MSRKLTVQQAVDRLRSRCVEGANGCWVYSGSLNRLGYGYFNFHGKRWMAHRFMYWHMKEPFDTALDCCHSCDNPSCINPDHIWIGDPKANSRDCVQKGRHYKAARTHCPRGHSYAEHGTYQGGRPWRVCRICDRATWRIRAGWPEDLAYALPRQKLCRKVGIGRWDSAPVATRKRTHCKRGHLLDEANSYPKPNGGRQCRRCHDAAVEAWHARGRKPFQPSASQP